MNILEEVKNRQTKFLLYVSGKMYGSHADVHKNSAKSDKF